MRCPACGSELSERKVGKIVVDLCTEGCGGIWLDRDEILAIDEDHEPEVPIVAEFTPASDLNLNQPGTRECPRCPGNYLVPQSYDSANPVEIEICWNCTGIWLDHGEIDSIRKGGGDKSMAGNPEVKAGLDLSALAQSLQSTQKAETFCAKIAKLRKLFG